MNRSCSGTLNMLPKLRKFSVDQLWDAHSGVKANDKKLWYGLECHVLSYPFTKNNIQTTTPSETEDKVATTFTYFELKRNI